MPLTCVLLTGRHTNAYYVPSMAGQACCCALQMHEACFSMVSSYPVDVHGSETHHTRVW